MEAWIAARHPPQKVVFRARIVVLAAQQASHRAIARQLGTTRDMVILGRQRCKPGRTRALTEEAPGRGRKLKVYRGHRDGRLHGSASAAGILEVPA